MGSKSLRREDDIKLHLGDTKKKHPRSKLLFYILYLRAYTRFLVQSESGSHRTSSYSAVYTVDVTARGTTLNLRNECEHDGHFFF